MKPASIAADTYPSDEDSASIVGTVRLVLAASTIITVLMDPAMVQKMPAFTWVIFSGFTLHNVALYLLAHVRRHAPLGTLSTWIDLAWYTLLVFVTGGQASLFFMFYFFSILTTAFRFGFDEGARVTLASAVLFSLTAHSATASSEVLQVLLRAAFLLALGYMIARWGEANLVQKRRLALLRDVSRLSNPRFGVEHTINDVLQRVRHFFQASSCVMVSRRLRSPRWALRVINDAGASVADLPADDNSDATAPLLMSLPPGMPVLYTSTALPWLPRGGAFCYYDLEHDQWRECEGDAGERLAEMLEVRSFISTPLSIQNSEGRAFMASVQMNYSRADVLFLCQIAGQVVPVLENIYLLDRLASEAALRERRKISRDLHDSTVQPYIGLSHTLTALRAKAAPDNPLFDELDTLALMTAEVVRDLRHYVGGFAKESGFSEPLFYSALRHHARQVRLIYGIDIALEMPVRVDIGDRLAAAAVHLITEGISNIRKHTAARQAWVRLRYDQESLNIEIENPNDASDGPAPAFYPVSISERTLSLGGTIRIEQRNPARTVVCIDIPI
ncbi:Histidine kinase [Massilia sp. CF038]|nr:Histidine kinase [Massilia sp. CF038]